jgi:hypothetical protein
MSFLGFGKTLFEKLKELFEKIELNEPQIEKAALITLNVALPLAVTIIGLTAREPAAASVVAIVNAVETELNNVTSTISTAGLTPTVTGGLNAVLTNLDGLLKGAYIKDPATLAKVEGVTKTIVGEIESILKVI